MASYTCPRYQRSELAAADLSAKQFYYVADDGTGKYNVAGSVNGQIGAGFLLNNPEANEACEVATVGGGAKGVAAETISAVYTELKALSTGKVAPALPGDLVIAIAMETAAVDDVFEVMPVYYPKAVSPVVFQSASDLTSGQYLYVGDSSGDIDVVGDATGAIGYGFLMNAPDSGEDAVINGPGQPFAKGISGAAFSIGVELLSDANGKMIAATTAGDIVVAIALGAATGADETINVIPVLYRKHA